MECIVDVEFNCKNNFILIGVRSKSGYRYFLDIKNFLDYIEDFKLVYCYNLEYDYSFFLRALFRKGKVYLHYHSQGLSFIDVYYKGKRQIWRDLAYHCNMLPVKEIAKFFDMKKGKINYEKMSIKTLKTVIKYNKNDCEIEWKILQSLNKLYRKFKCNRARATVGSNAMEIYRNFFSDRIGYRIPQDVLKEWQKAYRGGYCDVFKKGKYTGKFYLIDVNSLYPFIMLNSYPLPSSYKKVEKIRPNEKFYIIRTEQGYYSNYDVEYLFDNSKDLYYYVFTEECYPFKRYINMMMKYKIDSEKKGKKFEKMIYKTLANSLYGKFGQQSRMELLTNEKNIKKYLKRPECNIEEIVEDIFKIWWIGKFPFWTNFVYSIFTTSRARLFLYNAIETVKELGFEVYYCDTDSLLISGDISKLKDWIDPYQIGKWKLVKRSKSINIIGKKLFTMGDMVKCKGVSGFKNKKEFILTGKTTYDKFIKIKEGLRRNIKAGRTVKVTKRNLVNL